MCGVAAWLGDAAPLLVYDLLLSLQHRGQESAGIAVMNGDARLFGGPGLVVKAIEPSILPRSSRLAVGHVRYSTSGSYGALYQPLIRVAGGVKLAVAFNGNIVNFVDVGREVLGRSYAWDAELLADLIAYFYREEGGLAEAVREAAKLLEGSYSLVVASTRGELVAARDPRGVRPLAYSTGDNYAAVASETAALESLGLGEWRELPRASMLVCDGVTCSVEGLGAASDPAPCVFEYVYFMRPDSVFEGVEVHSARVRMGEELAKLDSVEADVVAPVPDSGRSAAIGYARTRGMQLDEVLYPNRFLGRSFILPPSARSRLASLKYGVVRSAVRGRRIVLVDDSLVRGTTARRLVAALKARGAREVHLRIASPPVRCPCFLGIDFPTRVELAAHGRSVDEVAKLVGADSVLYNTVEGLRRAVGLSSLCLGCFTCRYPLEVDLDRVEEIFNPKRRAALREGCR